MGADGLFGFGFKEIPTASTVLRGIATVLTQVERRQRAEGGALVSDGGEEVFKQGFAHGSSSRAGLGEGRVSGLARQALKRDARVFCEPVFGLQVAEAPACLGVDIVAIRGAAKKGFGMRRGGQPGQRRVGGVLLFGPVAGCTVRAKALPWAVAQVSTSASEKDGQGLRRAVIVLAMYRAAWQAISGYSCGLIAELGHVYGAVSSRRGLCGKRRPAPKLLNGCDGTSLASSRGAQLPVMRCEGTRL